jgi:hypothetical protein
MKRVIFTLLAVVVICSIAHAKYSGGSGEPNNPYQIANVTDLLTLAADANDYNKCFILIADINLDPNLPGNQVFTTAVIARDMNNTSYWYNFEGNAFTGVFDGAGHKITNLTIDTNGLGNEFLGLFGDVNDGEIKNLGLENVKITGGNDSDCAGGLAGRIQNGTISNCFSTGDITVGNQLNYLGGLIGEIGTSSSISNSRSTSNVTGETDAGGLGGLAGRNLGVISDCFSTGTVTGGNFTFEIGGLVGDNGVSDSITNSYSTSNVIGGDCSMFIGGLAGTNSGIINDCFFTGSLTGGIESLSIGGLVGEVYGGSISNCYSTGAVYGAWNLGGLVGLVDIFGGNISNCYSTGNVTGDDDVGGLVGRTFSGTISKCYSTGEVSGTHNVGGFLGYQFGGTISSSYFLDTSGPANGYGQPLTDTQMKQQASFVGWDFVWETANGPNDIWAICEGVTYPKLAWQYVVGDSDNDKDVDFTDFALMGSKWRQADSNLYCGGTDLTGNKWVDLDDLDALVENWLDAQ